MSFGKRPFGACLAGPTGEVLLTSQSIDVVNHAGEYITTFSALPKELNFVFDAESSLARLAVTHFDLPFLWTCTLSDSIGELKHTALTSFPPRHTV